MIGVQNRLSHPGHQSGRILAYAMHANCRSGQAHTAAAISEHWQGRPNSTRSIRASTSGMQAIDASALDGCEGRGGGPYKVRPGQLRLPVRRAPQNETISLAGLATASAEAGGPKCRRFCGNSWMLWPTPHILNRSSKSKSGRQRLQPPLSSPRSVNSP